MAGDVCCPKPEVQGLLSERTGQLTCTKAGGLTTHSPANDLLPCTLLSRSGDEHPGVDSHPRLQGGTKEERGSLDRELALAGEVVHSCDGNVPGDLTDKAAVPRDELKTSPGHA